MGSVIQISAYRKDHQVVVEYVCRKGRLGFQRQLYTGRREEPSGSGRQQVQYR